MDTKKVRISNELYAEDYTLSFFCQEYSFDLISEFSGKSQIKYNIFIIISFEI